MTNIDKALDYVADGMAVGLGSGRAAERFIRALAAGRRHVRCVATSAASAGLATGLGLSVVTLDDVSHLDLTVDGADEVDPQLNLIKGYGRALVREKIVAAASRRMIVIADASKRVDRIGKAKLPVEILPFAQGFVTARLEALGARIALRTGYQTDQGNIIADCIFPEMPDPSALATHLSAIPGVLGHGLFLDEVDCAYIGDGDRVIRLESRQPPAAPGVRHP